MANVDAAEKEASEVLHSLLSVERIVKTEERINAVTIGGVTTVSEGAQMSNVNTSDSNTVIPWHAPVAISSQSLFSAINEANQHFPQTMEEPQVMWEGHTIQVDQPTEIDAIYANNTIIDTQTASEPAANTNNENIKKVKPKPKLKNGKKNIKGKKRKLSGEINSDPTKLEDSAVQVKERFRRGCECQDERCFRGLSAESVYKHRLNIAELTKGEHDMYLMGVTMACLANPETTVRHKERRRLRAQYVYQGRRVCLDAFLYLENCTHYQLKRIRKHVMTHGVAPRVHGNHGKKPHNTFSLDIYKHATEFLKQYLETHAGETGITNSKTPIQLPWDITRKNLHDAYKEYGQILEPGIKLMGYSTFRHFMKEQFPHVKFCKAESKSTSGNANAHQNSNVTNSNNIVHHQNHTELKNQQDQAVAEQQQQQQQRNQEVIQKTVITAADVQQVIPLVVSQGNDNNAVQHHQQTTFLVAPVPQLLPNGSNLVSMQNATTHSANTAFPYQITNTGYVINEQGNIVTTMASQHHPSYAFNRM